MMATLLSLFSLFSMAAAKPLPAEQQLRIERAAFEMVDADRALVTAQRRLEEKQRALQIILAESAKICGEKYVIQRTETGWACVPVPAPAESKEQKK